MGDSGSEPEVQQSSTIRPSQEQLIDRAAEFIGPRIGTGATPFEGQRVADPSDISTQAFQNFQNFDTFGRLEDTLSGGFTDPTFTHDPEDVANRFQTGFADPLLQTFREQIVPELEEQFSDELFSTRRADFVADKTREFTGSVIAPRLFEAQQESQRLAVGSAEAAKGREERALDLPFKQVQEALSVGAAQEASAQRVLDTAYQEFLRTADEQDPWTQLAAQIGGLTTFETVGMQGQQGTDYAQLAAQLGMVAMFASDRNVKTNIQVIDDALYKVSMLSGVTFEYTDAISPEVEGRDGGIIAQDLESVMPNMVKEIDGIRYVRYNAVIGLLVNAVNELQQKVEEL